MFTRTITFMTHKLSHDGGAGSVEYATVMLFTSLVLVFALVVGFDGLLDGVPDAIVNGLP